MNSVFIPPKDKFPVNSCSQPCDNGFVPTPLCDPLCEPYTFGPFTAPTTIYTYYKYPDVENNKTLGCANSCNNRHVSTELKYEVYQILDGVEEFVGYWTIKDKEGPNKRKFEECGEYILRFCSQPPNECAPVCARPKAPKFHISKCGGKSPSVLKVCIKNKELPDSIVEPALLVICVRCSDLEDKPPPVSLLDITGSVYLDIDKYNIVECC